MFMLDQQTLIIYKFDVLFNILMELKDHFNFKIIRHKQKKYAFLQRFIKNFKKN